MVSRKGNFKFSEGEKVLCYEPDPAKTKVLYDSKVLEVACRKDNVTGRKVAQFLIHFQGWSSTWDRFVTEEFILKDNEENRRLQRELADRAQLTAGFGNLYKKDRKKRPGSSYIPRARTSSTEGNQTDSGATSPPSAPSPTMGVKRPYSTLAASSSTVADDHHANSTGGSSGASAHDDPLVDDAELANASGGGGVGVCVGGGGGGGAGGGGGVCSRPPIRAHFTITSRLREWFELDQARIKQQNKLVVLPAEPSAVDVLQMWFVDYTQSQIRHMCFHKRGHLRPSAGKKQPVATVENIQRCANLCHEVADGLRVYMDHVLPRLLLYNEERDQFDKSIPGHDSEHGPISRGQDEKPSSNHNCANDSKTDASKDHNHHIADDTADETESRRKSLRSHSTPVVVNSSEHNSLGARSPSTIECTETKLTGSSSLQHAADISALLSNDTMVCGGEHLSLRPMTTQEKDVLNKILSRKLVPENFKSNVVPSVIYGPIHLARCLLKMSDLLVTAEYGETQVNLLIDYLNNFMRFLEEHPEWFSDDRYVDARASNSTVVNSTGNS